MQFDCFYKFVLALVISMLVFNGCREKNSIPENTNQTAQNSTPENSADTAAIQNSENEFCEKIYAETLEKFKQDYVSCLSDLKVETAACPKPEGFDEGSRENLNIVIALDASGSMNGKIAGARKMDIAKKSVASFVDTLPENANVSLIAYGHRGSNSAAQKEISCQAVETIYPMQKLDKAVFLQTVNSLEPTGWTPLGGAIKKSGEVLKEQSAINSANLIYIVSDGIETCGGNPVQSAADLRRSNTKAIVNIIGFDVDNEAQTQLKAAAEAGGGQYYDARNADELAKVFSGVSKSVAEYEKYRRCLINNKQDVYRLFSNQKNEIFLCVFNKLGAESRSIFNEKLGWSRTKDSRDKCSAYISQKQSLREQKIKAWRDNFLKKVEREKNVQYQEIENELRSVTEPEK